MRTLQDDPEEVALASCTALTAFTASTWIHDEEMYPDLREAAFRQIIACIRLI